MTFQTTYLDRILAKQRFQLEEERQNLLEKTIDWLDHYGSQYGIKQAYIFGSLTRKNQFSKESDIDVAVEITNTDNFFSLIGFISEATGRDVDLILLTNCHFANRIRERGIQWTPKN
jgi:hypothetical protein